MTPSTDVLLVNTDESLDVTSERQSMSSASDSTQSTVLSDGSDHAFRRKKPNVPENSDDVGTRWSKDRKKTAEACESRETEGFKGPVFPQLRADEAPTGVVSMEVAVPTGEGKLPPTECRDGGATPPSKILESCSSLDQRPGQASDLFSIPLGELLQSKEDLGWLPNQGPLPPTEDFTVI